MSAPDRIMHHGGLLMPDPDSMVDPSYDLNGADDASSVSGFAGLVDYPPPIPAMINNPRSQPHRFSVRIGSIAGAGASRDQRMGSNTGSRPRGGVSSSSASGAPHIAVPNLPNPQQQRSLAASCGGSTNNSASQLFEAATSGDLGRVRHLVFEAGVTPDFSDDSGRTPLHCAAMSGQAQVVQLLLQTGCNVDGEDCDGSPPLYYAARSGHLEVVRLLLAHGCPATVDKQNFDTGNTAVHEAAARGYSQTLKLLIHAKANIAMVNKELNTPLHLAAQYGHNQCSRILLYAGASVESRNNHGDSVLHVAARHGSAGVVRVLLAGVLGGGGSGALSGAMSARGGLSGSSSSATAALLSAINRGGETPLHLATIHRHRNVVRLLLDAGADPLIRNRQGETAAQLAQRKGLTDIATMIGSFMRMGSGNNQQQQQWMMAQPPTSPLPGGYPNDGGYGTWQNNQPGQQQPAPFFNLVPSTRPGVKQPQQPIDPYGSLRYCHQHYQNQNQVPSMGYPGTVAPISYAARPMVPNQQVFFPPNDGPVHVLGGFDASGQPLQPQTLNSMAQNGKTKVSGKESTASGKQVAFAANPPSAKNQKSGKSMFSWVERRFDALVTKLSTFKGEKKSSKKENQGHTIPANAAEEILQQQNFQQPMFDDRLRMGGMYPIDRPPLPSHAFQQQQQIAAFRQNPMIGGSYRGQPPPFLQQQQQQQAFQNLPPFDQPQAMFQQPLNPMYQGPLRQQQPQHGEQASIGHLYQQRPQQGGAGRLYRTRSDDTLSVSDYKCQTWKKYHRALRAVDDTAFATDAAVRLQQQQIMRMCPPGPRPTSASASSLSSGGSVMSGPIAADRAEQILAQKRNNQRQAVGGSSSQGAATMSAASSVHSGSNSQGGHPPAAFHPTSIASECTNSGVISAANSLPEIGVGTGNSSPNEVDITTKPQCKNAPYGCSSDIDLDTASVLDHQPCVTESFKIQGNGDPNSPSLTASASTPAKMILTFLKDIASNAQTNRRPINEIQPSVVSQRPQPSSVSSSAGAALAMQGDGESAENEMVFHSAGKPPTGSQSCHGYPATAIAQSNQVYQAMHLRCSVSSASHQPHHVVMAQNTQKIMASSSSSTGGMCVSGHSIAHDSQSPSGASNQSSGYESVKIAAQFLMAAPSRPTATSTPEKNIGRGMALPHQRPELSPIETPRRVSSPLLLKETTPTKTPVAKLTKSPMREIPNLGALILFPNPLPVPPSPVSSPLKREQDEQENAMPQLPILPRPVPAPIPTSLSSSLLMGRFASAASNALASDSNIDRALSYQRLSSSNQSSPIRSLAHSTSSANPYATVRAPFTAVATSPNRQLENLFNGESHSTSAPANSKQIAPTVTSQV